MAETGKDNGSEGYGQTLPDRPESAASIKAKLMIQLSDLARAIPHRKGCPRQPPFEGNWHCNCDIGTQLGPICLEFTKLIIEVTEP